MLSDLLHSASQTVELLAGQVRDSTALGRPGDASDYASALRDAAAAYRDLYEAADRD